MTERIRRTGKILIVLGAVIVTLALGGLDYLAHPSLYFLLLYLVPLAAAAWFAGLGGGLVVVLADAAAWIGVDWLAILPRSDLGYFLWYLFSRVVLFAGVAALVARLKRSLEIERAMTRTDSLTGLANRKHFFAAAETEISRARRYKHPFSLVLFDIDGLRAVNEAEGYRAGDRILAEIGRILAANVRRSDIPARIGGDEFAVWLPETRFGPAGSWIMRARDKFSVSAHGSGLALSASVAAVTFQILPGSMDEVLKIAEDVMTAVKKEGKGLARHEVWVAEKANP